MINENVTNVTRKIIWDTMSPINVNKYVETKAGFKYLSWADAWSLLIQHFPESRFTFLDDKVYADGSMEVQCTLHIGPNAITMFLPVLNFANKPVPNPTAFDINKSRMRCLVKAIALLTGLGLYLYRGEDLPENPKGLKKVLNGKVNPGVTNTSATPIIKKIDESSPKTVAPGNASYKKVVSGRG